MTIFALVRNCSNGPLTIMNSRLICFITILTISYGLAAQDKINTVNGDIFNTEVLSIDSHNVKLKPFNVGSSTISTLPRNYIKSIEFKDGFLLPFTSDGGIIRDDLSEVPTVKAKVGKLYAEGIIPMKEEEILQRLGNEQYYLSYKPAKTRTTLGLSQAIFSVVMFIPCFIFDDKDVFFRNDNYGTWFTKMNIRPYPQNRWYEYNNYYFKGHINPYYTSLEIFNTITAISGITNILISLNDVKKSIDNTPVSYNKTITQNWTGIGLTVAGVGLITGGIIDMSKNTDWLWTSNYYQENINKKGNTPLVGAILSLTGSILFNVGLSEIIVSQKRLSAYKNQKFSTVLDSGFTPGGYSLVLKF